VIHAVRWALAAALLVALGTSPAGAAPPRPYGTQALVVGSLRGGPGQADLRFAQDDARRVRDVLVELGGFAPEAVALLDDPSPGDLLAALDAARARLAADAARGEPSVFLFYYSGHARAQALALGPDELPLPTLRERLLGLPATVTLAVLDACQAGALSGVKGARPTADFSANTVETLQAAGVAVMASSTGSELSQESPELGASLFTHHLLTGLRGAADLDGDGRVSLSEAYDYAHDRTLVASAATAVGRQHVTLETDLRGRGDVVLTWPAEATSGLGLPADLEGDVLVHTAPGGAVVAEVAKAAGSVVRLALPAGGYEAVVRAEGRAWRCPLTLAADATATLASVEGCEEVPLPAGAPKAPAPWRETWGLELGVGLLLTRADRYIDRLEEFGYGSGLDPYPSPGFSVTLAWRFHPNVSAVLGWQMLDRGELGRTLYDLAGEARSRRFTWNAHAIGAGVRGTLPLWRDVIEAWAQGGLGLTWGATTFRDELPASPETDDQLFWGWHLRLALGVQLMPWDHFGFFVEGDYTYAPTIDDLVGDTHDSGGPAFYLGVRGAL